jgi:chromosome segregation protein
LERSREGLGAGPRELLALLERPDPGPWRGVLGLTADVLTVRREFAPLIDLALGEQAQRFLVRDLDGLAAALGRQDRPFSSRVGFLQLPPAPAGAAADAGAESLPGVVAPAWEVVRCDAPELAGLPTRLLGRTLIVRDLDAARAVAALRPGCRCVTLRGELLEPGGALTVGTHHAEAGILSRKSELRELRGQAAALDARLAELDRGLAESREAVAGLEDRLGRQQLEIGVLADQSADLRSRIGQRKERRQGLHEEVTVSRSEITGLEREIRALEESWRQARDEAARAEARVQELQARLEGAERAIREGDAARGALQVEAVAAQVALAQSEERRAALAERQGRLEADLRHRTQEARQAGELLADATARRDGNDRALLQASAALAAQHHRKERAERRREGHAAGRERSRAEKQQRAEQAQAVRGSWRARQEQAHALGREVHDLRGRRDGLCDRLREDYQIDLAELHAQAAGPGGAAPPDLDPAAAEEEIAELRRKLTRLGGVNPDAIQELDDLEKRYDALRLQHDDLTAAERSLQEIIARINADSRRLFAETFQTVRTHFQELFRKLFGGGMADVVLEDESDVLESGIEVVARPPGKELRSISLMSGGEKTLTAVALLLAIFQSKPSPFCILDEVDAALDEANVGRFTAVLREFLDRSQFILITHSKRTMACADVLYGVTMQESGVSRRIAVRFEDWPDDEKAAAA